MDEQRLDRTTARATTSDAAADGGYEPPALEDLQHPDGPTGMPAGPGVTTIAAPREL